MVTIDVPRDPCGAELITTPGMGGISGSVVLMGGASAAGVSVSLDLTPVATADSSGNFCLVNLAPRQYAVSAKTNSQGSVPKNVLVQANSVARVYVLFNTTAMPRQPATAQGGQVARRAATPEPPTAASERR